MYARKEQIMSHDAIDRSAISILPVVPEWPNAGGRRIVFLLDTSSATEATILQRWIAQNCALNKTLRVDTAPLPPSRRRKKNPNFAAKLEMALHADDDPLLAPLRIAWLPKEVAGARKVRFRDLLTFRDPRDPSWIREKWTLRFQPDRCRIVCGQPAPLSELNRRWLETNATPDTSMRNFIYFVALQAGLALERAERQLRGMRYKVPRFIHEDLLGSARFRSGLSSICREHGKSETRALRDAKRYLKEIAATHSPFVIDLAARLIRWLHTRSYSNLSYDQEGLSKIYALAQRRPVIFLPSHKSNLDHLVLQYVLYENGHPPNHTAGGINMNFFPIGALLRRSGTFFIRRSFRNNYIYKFVLRQYVEYLIENRFPLEWYIEGGRSRSGKLLPPRFGMLAYVVDAYRCGRSEDVILVPVSIAYDQIPDVCDYTEEQRGAKKQKENLGWFVRALRNLRQKNGEIHLRFAAPISLREHLGSPSVCSETHGDSPDLGIQKLGFEVCVRINRVTPITPISLVTLSLLSADDRALSLEEIRLELCDILTYVAQRNLPTTIPLQLHSEASICEILQPLIRNGIVTCFSEGQENVYAIEAGAYLSAAYYRNTIIHFFLTGAILELALLGAMRKTKEDPVTRFWSETLAIRDLLKFEFFFADKESFHREIRSELLLLDSHWENLLRQGAEGVRTLLQRIRPLKAHLVLRPFFAAYRIVGDALEKHEIRTKIDEENFLASCLALGKQYRLQQRIRSSESLSKVLFATALDLARNRNLLTTSTDIAARRTQFAKEIRDVLHRTDTIQALSVSRRAGLIE